MIDVYNVSHEEILEYLFAINHPGGNPTSSLTSHTDLTSPEVNDDIFDPEGDIIENLQLNDDSLLNAESELRELGVFGLNHGPLAKEMDTISKIRLIKILLMTILLIPFLRYPFDSKEEKIKDSKILIDELDLSGSKVDALSSTENEDKVFNPGILIHENLFEVTNCATPDKNVKKLTKTSLILEDFKPPVYELPFHKQVLGLGALLSFLFENQEKVFNPWIITSKRVHTSLLPELSHRGPKAFKVIKILESPMEIFPCSYGEDIRVLDVPCLHFYPP
ncbi:hypothetical protein Tco_0278570 [Tanacetum coccineum]